MAKFNWETQEFLIDNRIKRIQKNNQYVPYTYRIFLATHKIVLCESHHNCNRRVNTHLLSFTVCLYACGFYYKINIFKRHHQIQPTMVENSFFRKTIFRKMF